ncbi:uncharacterized protein TRIADDRAFT_54251 [Trichoplax adhaerens]|uniref:Solute carrier family 35 member G1 n=1 Tax=Trichoplax adhaerens TaxID=10228 RepID=B3RRI5_TRIAD|nr:hypothetical protein TRIADDRAFT_54251 [Trichoplax adhaerens]EDV26351.1 hypothetical protein TRIADDRAFT_54251 [Trichoplax adhaerens]|eukprot:XP_002110347.1 hypothetical protein TRIADDRAFT_54251 [Trichoplax adhaerens]
MSACVKLAAYDFFLVAAIRSAVQILLLQSAIIKQQKDLSSGCKRPQVYFVLGRTIAGTVSVCCQFYAYQNMNIGDASAIIFSSPFITGILAAILLKERFTVFNLLATLVSFGGIILVARPPFIFRSQADDAPFRFAAASIAFAASIATSIAILNIRKIGNKVDSYVITYYFSIVCFIVPIIIFSITTSYRLPQCGATRWLLIAVGVLGFLGQISFTNAIQLEKATLISIIRTTDVIFGYILELIIFGSSPSLLSIFGSLLIIAGASALALKKWYDIKSDRKDCNQSKTTEQSINQHQDFTETHL